MTLPSDRLVCLVAATVAPSLAIAVAYPVAAPVCGTIMGMAALACVLDILVSLGRAAAVTVSAPGVVHLTLSVQQTIPVLVHWPHASGGRLRVVLLLPGGIDSVQPVGEADFGPGAGSATVPWSCVGARRGNFTGASYRLEVSSRMGLFLTRSTGDLQCRIRIYPDLRRDYRRLAPFFLNREAGGVHMHAQVGRGREFERLREYVHGDSYGDIHWKATAKRRRPITKVYQIERTQQVYVAIDTSRLTERVGRSAERPVGTVLDGFVSASLMLAGAAQRQGDLYGALAFGGGVKAFVKASRGPAHYSLFRDTVCALQSEAVSPDYQAAASHVRTGLRRRALVLFLTCLDDPVAAEEFVRSIETISRQHLVVAVSVGTGATRPLFSGPVTTVGQIYEHLGSHVVWHQTACLEKLLRRSGVRFIAPAGGDIAGSIVAAYANIKQRQLL